MDADAGIAAQIRTLNETLGSIDRLNAATRRVPAAWAGRDVAGKLALASPPIGGGEGGARPDN